MKTTFFKHFTQHCSHFQTQNIPNCAEDDLLFNKNGHESFGSPSSVLKSKLVCNHALLTQITQNFKTGG